jgi:hypothetical protein
VALKARVEKYLVGEGYTIEDAAAEAAKYSGRVGMYTAASEAGLPLKTLQPTPGTGRSMWRRSTLARRTS